MTHLSLSNFILHLICISRFSSCFTEFYILYVFLIQKLTPPACGLLMLLKKSADSSIADDSLGPNEILVYLKLDHTPTWTQQHTHQNQEVFTRCVCVFVFMLIVCDFIVTNVCVSVFHREMLLHVLSNSQPVVCYKAKDLLCTALQFYRRDISWKQGRAHA